MDIVYGNWNGPHRLYLQMSAHGKVRFRVRRGLSFPRSLPPTTGTVSGPGRSQGAAPPVPPTRPRRSLWLCRAWGREWGATKMVTSEGQPWTPNLGCCNVSNGPEQRQQVAEEGRKPAKVSRTKEALCGAPQSLEGGVFPDGS